MGSVKGEISSTVFHSPFAIGRFTANADAANFVLQS